MGTRNDYILAPFMGAVLLLAACQGDKSDSGVISSKQASSTKALVQLDEPKDEEETPVEDGSITPEEINETPAPVLPDPSLVGSALAPFSPYAGFIGGGGGGGGFKDLCPLDNRKTTPGVCGCGIVDEDSDNDGIIDCVDNCVDLANSAQTDEDADAVGADCDCDDNNQEVGALEGQARYVASNGDNNENDCLNKDFPCATIIYAIATSNASDTIILADGTFLENTIVLNKNIAIHGQGQGNSIVNAQGNGRVFEIPDDVSATICGLTVTGGFIDGPGSDLDLVPGAGGGVFNDGTLALSNVLVTQNSANLAAGGVWNNTSAVMSIKNSTISLNTSSQSVGGFGNYYLATMTIDNSLITNNTAGFVGGGGGSAGSSLRITNTTVSNNTASQLAGGLILVEGLVSVGNVSIQDSEFLGNSSALGGGIITNGVASNLQNTVFSNNSATQDAGAIAVVGEGVIQITNSTFNNNTAVSNGGALFVTEDSRVFAAMSTFNNNSAASGGGFSVIQSSEIVLTNSTISGNTASTQGGGIYVNQESDATINVSTIAFNTAASGGGIYKFSDSGANSFGSIFSNNGANNCATDSGNVLGSADYILASDLSCTFGSGTNNVSNTNPLLGPLQDNGGPTNTHALLAGSPAIDGGDVFCFIPIDQRGEPRPVNIPAANPIDGQNRCDIGSFEVQLP